MATTWPDFCVKFAAMNFTLETGKCTWTGKKEAGSDPWVLEFYAKPAMGREGESAIATFRLPAAWTRVRVFQFIDSIDQNVI